ncbi:LysE family translocator [Pseudoalteromonas sp. JBTF-M23]|uniref:LysE family translocator n=1 Tax=Pseudoalteromonas caenipelagi TaxID=2726988 RepID=A0A849VKH1_9GAMM|nr:LysE family translocator [Pseudoalteromonas caenipelagi]NOU52284.1 LysE family translocator [Pseudoalteromonas caenipelagi]
MTIEFYLGYCVIIMTLLLSPGPSVQLCINNGLHYTKEKAAFGVLGNVLAFQLLLIISATGSGAILLASSTLLTALKVVGAMYLCYLGVKSIRLPVTSVDIPNAHTPLSAQRAFIFKQAFWVTLLNPKALVFVCALQPQFIDSSKAVLPQVTILCLTSAVIHFVIYFGYVALANSARGALSNEYGRSMYNKLSGLVFIAFGMFLFLSMLIER